ncbi:hypothetical protein GOQ29_03130 [Clostridium sp. D2Q-14]|uniref:hypothetical protein n=1 Tax=Anaeromonas gelatinilytica TaxID=2683194 RepID=UPI00193BAE62|nr:hypothetical protein [Anaeromonas gelatinilytica]MBS4534602.1 hypothetical protein [Anaeromonas gelatinilytica]
MNEVSVSNQKEIDRSPFSNPLLLILLIPIIKNVFSKNNNFSLKINDFKNINITRILDKVDVLIKVAPYLPSDLIKIINKYLPLYDRLSKAFIVMEFFSRSSIVAPIVVANELNPKEKTDRVSYILKEELPKNEYQKISPFINIATNLDTYKGVIKSITNLNNDDNTSNNLNNIIKILGPLLGQSEENMDKMNEILKMIELINLFGDDDDKKSNNNIDEAKEE